MVRALTVLAMNPSDLQVVRICQLLELVHLLSKVVEAHVHRCAHACANVGWARCQVAQAIVMCELYHLFDFLRRLSKTCEYLSDVSALLHRNNSELVFLIDPNKESLVIVVEDATTLRPVPVETGGLQEAVSLLEKEKDREG